MNRKMAMNIMGILAVFVIASGCVAEDSSADMSKPVQVFILMGQSNMVGMGKISRDGGGKARKDR